MGTTHYDVAIVGAGIVGLAHAYHAARRGWRVLVLERGERAEGASIRNFGMLWPIGQPPGERYAVARRSLDLWRDVLAEARLWSDPRGSLHLAYEPDEEAVLREFLDGVADKGYEAAWEGPDAVLRRAPKVRREGLIGAMWSHTEICVDPREVIAGLPAYLKTRHGVDFEFGVGVTATRGGSIEGGGRTWAADRVIVCSGDELQALYPTEIAALGLSRCKLQMLRMRAAPAGWMLGPMLAAGLTLRHYKSFEGCPSLPALRERFARELPEYDRYGIHVMACQNGSGEVVIGDSHEYDDKITPFDRDNIHSLVLKYLERFLAIAPLRLGESWHGIYVKHPTEPWVILRPEEGVTVVTGVGGAGMTLSFGLAEQVVTGLD